MSGDKKYTEKTEVTTETDERSGSPVREDSQYKKTTTVKTERKIEKDDDTVIVIDE